MMVPTAYIEHQIPGRMRLRIPEKRGDVAFFERVVGALSKQPDVRQLDASPLTGSIRIAHSGSAEAIAAAGQGLFHMGERPAGQQPGGRADAARPEGGAMPGEARMLDAIAAGLSGLAVVQAGRGELTGSAAENFWNAYGAQRVLGRTEIAAGFALLGVYQLLQGQWLGSASSLFFYAMVARRLAAVDRAAAAFSGRGAGARTPPAKASSPKRTTQRKTPRA